MNAWGGSEELWAEAALFLTSAGHEVTILKTVVDKNHLRTQQLRAAGCQVMALTGRVALPQRVLNRVLPVSRQWSSAGHQAHQVQQHLLHTRPNMVLVAQGANFDGLSFAEVCRHHGQPYALLSQNAAEIFFPTGASRLAARTAYQVARHCYFVSRHNLELTQYQLGVILERASVVRNPFNVPYVSELPAPGGSVVQLACVARLDVIDKGQDVLLRVLALPKWRARPLHVSFFGQGANEAMLQEMAQLLDLAGRVTWAGQVPDIVPVWASHHALVLASRFEGLPLALVEAMLCGRPAIATAAGGTAELLLDNETGFLAQSPTVPALDEALERAWRRRAEWPALGQRAAAYVRTQVPANPGGELAQQLLQLVHSLT